MMLGIRGFGGVPKLRQIGIRAPPFHLRLPLIDRCLELVAIWVAVLRLVVRVVVLQGIAALVLIGPKTAVPDVLVFLGAGVLAVVNHGLGRTGVVQCALCGGPVL